MASTTGQVLPDAKLERRTRRKFTEQEKFALLEEFDSLKRGEKGVWLRRKGLYSAQLADWRKTLERKGREGLGRPSRAGSRRMDRHGCASSLDFTGACQDSCRLVHAVF